MTSTRVRTTSRPTAQDGELPANWMSVRVCEAGAVQLGRQRSPRHVSAKYPTKYIRAANITWAGLSMDSILDMEFTPKERETYRLEPGDIVLAEASGSASEVGKPAVWPEGLGLHCFQNTVLRFRSTMLLPRFALHLFSFCAQRGIFAKASSGVGIHHLSAKRFSELQIPVAPQAEQERIADRIDELFTDLAAGVAALERVKRNLSRYRAAVLHAAVTGRLTEAWRKEHGPPDEPGPKLLERILTERRRQWEQRTLAKYEKNGKKPPKNWKSRYKEPVPPRAMEDGSALPTLPEGWCWANLECLKQFSMYGPRFSSDDYVADGVRVLRTTDFDGSGNIDLATPPMLPLTDEQYDDYKLESGDLLVTRTGSLGTLAVFQGGARAIAGAFLIYYRLNQQHVHPAFAFSVLKAPAGQRELRRRGTGVGRPNLNIPSIDSIHVPLPPLAEQVAIMEVITEKLSQIDVLEAEVERGLKRAGRMRQAILKAAFEGKLVPQDPGDEPASVLLERIRTEAAAAEPKPSRPKKKRTRKKKSSRKTTVK